MALNPGCPVEASGRADTPINSRPRVCPGAPGRDPIPLIPYIDKILLRRFLIPGLLAFVILGSARPVRGDDATGHPDESPPARGVNYIPSYAESSREIWSAYDPSRVAMELGWAADMGFNAVRIPLSYEAYRNAPATFLENFGVFVDAAREQGLRVMPVLFDGWGVAPEDELGSGRQTLRETYARIEANPAAYRMDRRSLKQFETVALDLLSERRVPRSRDPAVMLWGGWQASPSPEKIAPEYWAVYQNYVGQVVRAFADDETLLAWDVMNNPAAGSMWRLKRNIDEAHRFVAAMVDQVRAAGATQPVTVSFSEGYGAMGPLVNLLDALSTQSHSDSSREMMRALLELEAIRKDRPIFLTCAGGVLLPATPREAGDDHQTRRVRSAVTVAERQNAGWFLWHLIEGEGPCPWDGLLRRDGTRKPAADYLKKELRHLR